MNKLIPIIVLIIFMFFLVAKNSANAISSKNYFEDYKNLVEPYFYDKGNFGTFYGVENIPIKYASFEVSNEKGAIVILPGRARPFIGYAELIYDLKDQGYSIYIIDHRGQGLSGRILADRHKGHIDNFDNYIEDVKIFLREVVNNRPHKNLFLLANSMGGGIAVLVAERYQDHFDAMVLIAPMLHIDTGSIPEFIAQTISAAYVSLGIGDSYIWWHDGKRIEEPFKDNVLTHDYNRFSKQQEIKLREDLFVGGVTFSWLKSALEATWDAFKNAPRIKIPLLFFQAEEDLVIEKWRQEKVCERAQNCHLEVVTGSRHDILVEKDKIRDQVLKKTMTFFDSIGSHQ